MILQDRMILEVLDPLASSPKVLAELAAKLPCRTYPGTAGPYLSRYTLCELEGGGAVYLHFFHRSDADRELHNHPWRGSSVILTGGYVEERRVGEPGDYSVVKQFFMSGDACALEPDTFHRVDLIDEEEGCWTLFVAGPRTQSWGFWDRDTGVFTAWDEALRQRGLVRR